MVLRRRSRRPTPTTNTTVPGIAWTSVPPSWRAPVERVLAASELLKQTLAEQAEGPLQARLRELQPTIDKAVEHLELTIRQATEAQRLTASIDANAALAELKQARRDLEQARTAGGNTEPLEARVALLAERHRALSHAANVAEDTEEQLREISERVEAVVARGVALTLRSRSTDPTQLRHELDELLAGVSALDDALRELSP